LLTGRASRVGPGARVNQDGQECKVKTVHREPSQIVAEWRSGGVKRKRFIPDPRLLGRGWRVVRPRPRQRPLLPDTWRATWHGHRL